MFLRVDKLRFEQPVPEEANPNAAADVQELMGGKFGEISTLMNYMFQSFNFRNRENLNPYHAAPQARQRSCPSGARLGSRRCCRQRQEGAAVSSEKGEAKWL